MLRFEGQLETVKQLFVVFLRARTAKEDVNTLKHITNANFGRPKVKFIKQPSRCTYVKLIGSIDQRGKIFYAKHEEFFDAQSNALGLF